jgi:putative tryptophan/tyrosine transport system substrate-binding protein
MRRRDFLAGAALVVTCRSAQGQQPSRVYRIGYLGINQPTTPLVAKVWKAFDEGLRSHGLVEGENIIIRRLFSEGQEERQPGFVAELLKWKADVIVCGSMAGVTAASKATKTIPIILAGIGDPERLGTVKSLARPGVNITGLLSYVLDVARQYQVLKEIVPSLTRVAVLWNPNNPISVSFLQDIQSRIPKLLEVQITSVPIARPDDVATALKRIESERAEALDLFNSIMPYRSSILSFAQTKKIPVMVSNRIFLDPGVLVSYGPSLTDIFRRTAEYVDKVLKGANAADLPIERPTKIELTIDLRTARSLGIDIPPHVLALADELIE